MRINKISDEVSNMNNDYFINIKIDNFINDSNNKGSFIKKIFSKEKLNQTSKDFLDNKLHDFNVFKENAFVTKLDECLFLLKFRNKLSVEEIIENYKIYISKKLVQNIDFSFLENYTSNYTNNMREAFHCMDVKREQSVEFIA